MALGFGAWNFLLLDTNWEEIRICFVTTVTAWSGIECLRELIRLLTHMVFTVNRLALVSNSRYPAAVLAVLNW